MAGNSCIAGWSASQGFPDEHTPGKRRNPSATDLARSALRAHADPADWPGPTSRIRSFAPPAGGDLPPESRLPMKRLGLLLLPALLLGGCLSEAPQSGTAPAEPGAFQVSIAPLAGKTPLAARGAGADVGGKLFVRVTHSLRGISQRDSLVWSGTDDGVLSFPSLPEGAGYVVQAWYRDLSGITSHGDSIGGIRIDRGEAAQARLHLRPLQGKILVNAPVLPTGIDTLGAIWTFEGKTRRAVAGRGTGGRTSLRLDSLEIGRSGDLRLRAWNAAGDTLYHLDTTLVLSDDRDLALSLVLGSSRGQILASLSFQAGGEISATASFAGEADQPSSQTGRLLLTAFSDSGSMDWIGIRNPGAAFSGKVRLGKGSTDAQFDLVLPEGATAVVTRAPCAQVADTSHPLHGTKNLVCGLDDIVVTHSTAGGSYWKLRDASGAVLHDAVLVLDAKQSWPDLNSSSARTARLRTDWSSAFLNDAGRAWCADASDDPDAPCL